MRQEKTDAGLQDGLSCNADEVQHLRTWRSDHPAEPARYKLYAITEGAYPVLCQGEKQWEFFQESKRMDK